MLLRLDRALSLFCTLSRSEIKRCVAAGEVVVGGVVARRADMKVETDTCSITLAGAEIPCRRSYIMLNKPQGVVSATRDKAQKTVLDLLPQNLRRKNLFPAGRLDRDTEGFVLLTDDGDFAHRMLSPKKHVSKTYLAIVSGAPDEHTVQSFLAGVTLADNTLCRPASLRILGREGEHTAVRVVIHEGMYHQIKRMFASLGCEVLSLRREKLGGLELDESLLPGECREITERELKLILGED